MDFTSLKSGGFRGLSFVYTTTIAASWIMIGLGWARWDWALLPLAMALPSPRELRPSRHLLRRWSGDFRFSCWAFSYRERGND